MPARPKPDLADLEARLGHVFANRKLLEHALTHMSAAPADAKRTGSYQRLEFLGDRVLGICVAELLFNTYPAAEEGELSRRLADLVRKETCAEMALAWAIGPYLKVGDGEAASGARKNKAILADAFESIVGAIFLDGGYAAARQALEAALGDRLRQTSRPPRDAKTALQEWAQGQGLPTPNYIEVGRSGPDHAPVFKVAAHVHGLADGLGEGRSKRLAEQVAAENFLRREGLWREGEVGLE
ncbi:MAG: ribonuclease III [Beijerinckiaceae bacterium]|jgi:ribonuclease-3|nr:ribonuclease III [Beijerinckiaceae bacterium]